MERRPRGRDVAGEFVCEGRHGEPSRGRAGLTRCPFRLSHRLGSACFRTGPYSSRCGIYREGVSFCAKVFARLLSKGRRGARCAVAEAGSGCLRLALDDGPFPRAPLRRPNHPASALPIEGPRPC
jgi:hypothetical protein